MKSESALPKRMVFVGGAHMDQVMRLKQAPVSCVSNPAVVEAFPGGASLNSASIAAALGLSCAIVSAVGRDAQGRELVDVCKSRSIEPILVQLDGCATGLYSAIIDPEGNVVIGASDLSIYDRIDDGFLARHLLPVLTQNDGLFLTSNLSETVISQLAREDRFIAAVTVSPAKAGRMRMALPSIDLLLTNLGEARVLAAMANGSAEKLCQWLISNGVGSGTLSDGPNDLYYWEGGEVLRVLVEPNPCIVDVNGAGDALAGGVIAGICGGLAFREAVKQGMKAARYTVGHDRPFNPAFSSSSLQAMT